MQSLDVISINLWQILISLCNLVILFLILKKFLYKPVKNVVREREEDLKNKYYQAENCMEQAEKTKKEWNEKMQNADDYSKMIREEAKKRAEDMEKTILEQARLEAEMIKNRAVEEVEAERRKAEADIKEEISEVSALMAEKILSREITLKDQHNIIDDVISKIGDKDE